MQMYIIVRSLAYSEKLSALALGKYEVYYIKKPISQNKRAIPQSNLLDLNFEINLYLMMLYPSVNFK